MTRMCARSALEWVIDQYRVKIDRCSGTVNDPNWAGAPQNFVRLGGKVISVSLETVGNVEGLPELGVGEEVVEGVGMSEPAIMTASAGAHRAMLDVSSLRNLDHRCRLMKPPRI